jgi:hypothetical protein
LSSLSNPSTRECRLATMNRKQNIRRLGLDLSKTSISLPVKLCHSTQMSYFGLVL